MKKTIISKGKTKFSINTNIAFIDKNSRFILNPEVDYLDTIFPDKAKKLGIPSGQIVFSVANIEFFDLSNNSKIIRKLRKIHLDFNAKLFLPTKYTWTIGSYFIGKYIGPDNNTFNKDSMVVDCIGITKDLLFEIAEELIDEFKQFSVLVKYGKQIYFVPNKQVKQAL